jgi:hypothetical protein
VADDTAPFTGMRLDDAELWRCVDATLTGVVLPAIGDDQAWARAATVQLIGLVRYAASRPADATAARTREVAATLTQLAANELVDWDGEVADSTVSAAAGRALAAAVGRTDAAAEEIRAVLRPVLLRQLDDELAVTAPLVGAFRGVLDEGGTSA